jgi:hypothetical protein
MTRGSSRFRNCGFGAEAAKSEAYLGHRQSPFDRHKVARIAADTFARLFHAWNISESGWKS